MDINKWSCLTGNMERIMKRENIYDKINIRGLSRKELLEYMDLENQHNEQKAESCGKNKIFGRIKLSKNHISGSIGRLFNRAGSFIRG